MRSKVDPSLVLSSRAFRSFLRARSHECGCRTMISSDSAVPSGARAAISSDSAVPSGARAAISSDSAVPSGARAAISSDSAVPSGARAAISSVSAVPGVSEQRFRAGKPSESRILGFPRAGQPSQVTVHSQNFQTRPNAPCAPTPRTEITETFV